MIHKLKIESSFLDKIMDGTKKYEIRKDDRDFQVNDVCEFKEYDPVAQNYLSRSVQLVIIDVFGRKEEEKKFVIPGHVILSVERLIE